MGDIVATLKRLDLERDTLVFFCSDNGATGEGQNQPLRGHKGRLWEGGHRVPAIARWPGRIKAGSLCDELVLSMDLMPTMLALAGVSAPAERKLDGVNLLPLMLEGKRLGDRRAFWGYNQQLAMRDGPWKLVLDATGNRRAEL